MDTGEKNRLLINVQKVIASFPDQNSSLFLHFALLTFIRSQFKVNPAFKCR